MKWSTLFFIFIQLAPVWLCWYNDKGWYTVATFFWALGNMIAFLIK